MLILRFSKRLERGERNDGLSGRVTLNAESACWERGYINSYKFQQGMLF
jgi:hypothetical protein